MAYVDMWSELQGDVPRLSPLFAQRLVNRAWSRIRDFRLWSFQIIADAQLYAPAVISAGSLTTTQYSTAITADATATAALAAVGSGPPPLASATLGVGRQVRIGSVSGISSPTGPNYSITNFSGSTITIDRPYGESSGSNLPYQVLKCYYAPPNLPLTTLSSPDASFVRYLVVVNRYQGYSVQPLNLNWSQADLDAIDPQRGGQGDAYIFANYGRNSLGQPVNEMYPNPVNPATYYATYVTRWPDLSAPTDALPQMPYELTDCVMYAAKKLAGDWALGNVSTFQELQGTNWVQYIATQAKEFKDSLIQCIKVDDELAPIRPFIQGHGFNFPLGGQFLQGHDVTYLLGGPGG